MKAACLLIDSTYTLVVSDRGGMGMDTLDSGFNGTKEGARGDRITEAGSTGRGGVSETVVGTETGVSRIVIRTEAGIGTSSGCALLASLVRASDLVTTLPVPLSLDPLILTSKHHEHQPYTCHAHLGSALNLLP